MNGPKPDLPRAGWSLARLFFRAGRLRPWLRVVLYALTVGALFAMLVAVYFSGIVASGREPSGLTNVIVQVALSAVAVVGVSLIFRRYLDGQPLASLGLAPRGAWLRLFALGVLFGAAMQTLTFALEITFGHVRVLRVNPLASDVKIVAAAAVVFLVAALTEELSVRGYILQNLWEEWGFLPAAILSSLLFALLHFRNPHAQEQAVLAGAALLAFGLWASLSVLVTRSLWLALGCHAAWNVCEGPVFGFPVSGLGMPAQTALVVSPGAPAWFTGGYFGPEAGLAAMLAILAGAVALWLLSTRGVFALAAAASVRRASE